MVKERTTSVDALRGIIMIIMALDHTRDYFSNSLYSPTDLSHPQMALFWVRWITHFCAPLFVFLAGLGIGFSLLNGKKKSELSLFLLKRGVWLIFLELVVVRLGCFLDYEPSVFYLGVIWALGISMVILSALIFLPTTALFILGLTGVVGHNLFDHTLLQELPGVFSWILFVFHQQESLFLGSYGFRIDYPFGVWACLMILGVVFANCWKWTSVKRSIFFIRLALLLTFFFCFLRAFNIYGDPNPFLFNSNSWTTTLLSFFNTNKYPPSLLFLLMTIGPGLLFLGLWEKYRWQAKLFSELGKVPMMFYLLHFPLINGVAWLWFFLHDSLYVFWAPMSEVQELRLSYGFGPLGVILWWITFILIIYPSCLKYAQFKKKNPHLLWVKYL